MSEWLNKTRSVLSDFKAETGIQYFWKRCEADTAQLPDTYIVYFLVDDPGTSWADGEETAHESRMQVSLYFRNKSIYLTVPDQIEAAFMAANFMRVDSGDIPYQPDTGLYGWRCDFRFYERR